MFAQPTHSLSRDGHTGLAGDRVCAQVFGDTAAESGSGGTAIDVGREGIREGLRECRDVVRGYAWGTYLSARHIRALGGVERVIAEAPVFAVRDLSTKTHELLFVQLTESFETHSDDDLRRMKR